MKTQAITRIFALTAFLLVLRAAAAEEFSWSALLGASGENLLSELEKFSSCNAYSFSFDQQNPNTKAIPHLQYRLRRPIGSNAKVWIRNWHGDPVDYGSYGFVKEDELDSSVIRKLTCSSSHNTTITSLLFEDRVFDINIEYKRCPDHCPDFGPLEIDKAFSSKLPNKAIYVPGYGATAAQLEPYFKLGESLRSDRYLEGMLSDAGICHGIDGKYRCIIVSATTDNGIWHSMTMTEAFESGFFSERTLGRFASSQRFTLMEADKRAREAFTSEVKAGINVRRQAEREEDRQREFRENRLRSVQ